MKITLCLLALLGAASAAPNPKNAAPPVPTYTPGVSPPADTTAAFNTDLAEAHHHQTAPKPIPACFRTVLPAAIPVIALLARTAEATIRNQCQQIKGILL
ncbi:hypothetical protein TWF970_007960 [Orbilia oligospora]|uniref:Hydrophobin n=1 Tax=Orbilia oligospora TaxID=2813651 RepID=A0A7C8VAQ7_ORBOL|nr:hypothetical protein TWF970_007960 [Orbilia oligospora]